MIDPSNKFHNLLKANNLISVPFSPTHDRTWLDQFIVPESDYFRIFSSSQYTLPDISDHDLLTISYKAKSKRVKMDYRLTYDYSRLDAEIIMNYFSDVNWSFLHSFDNVNSTFQCFYDCLYDFHNNYVPMKKIVNSQSVAPWFNCSIAKSMLARDHAYIKYKKTADASDLEIYRNKRNRVTSLIRISKQKYFFGDTRLTMKRIWNSCNHVGLGTGKSNISTDLDPSTINSYFCNVPLLSVVIPLPEFECTGTHTSLSFSCVSEFDISKAVYLIKSNSSGHDRINLKFLKNILPYVISPLTYLINNCIMRSEFPDIWKMNIVIPIIKKKGIDSLDNLRPISLVSILSKIFEIILRDQINQHLTKSNYLNQFQSGFRNNHSTTTTLLHVVDDLASHLDKLNSFVVLILLDYSKAFDSLNHVLLLQKLMLFFNFDITALKLMFSYLTDRYQKVIINGKESEPERIKSGVFQGTILGPTLFSLFINDLPQVIKYSKYHLYADDCQIYLGGTSENILETFNNINLDLSNILDWSNSNGISLNIAKTQAIFISKRSFPVIPDIFIDSVKINFMNHVNNLGICINNRFTWDSQVVNVCGKINSILYGLKLHKNICPKNVRILLARSLVIPHVLYCEFLFLSCDSTSSDMLQVTLNNIVRYVNGLRKFDHVSAKFKEFFGCTMVQFFYYRALLLLYKVINNRVPAYLYDKIKIGSSRNGIIILPVNRTNVYNKSPLFTTFTIWNEVPIEIRSVKPFAKFQSLVFDYIQNKF